MNKEIPIGDIFGRMEIIKEVESKGKERYVLCKCECGETKEVRYNNLKNGHTKSCGCLSKEHIKTYKLNYIKI